MSRFLFVTALALTGVAAAPARAQKLGQPLDRAVDRLKLQLHGYAAQGLVYSTHNNWNLMDSTSGSFDWSDGVINLSAQPASKLRIGAQARYFRLGGLQNKVTLDWAQADYKVDEYFGIRAGKVKSPVGLLNESQDIDPAQLWVLLPQSVYNIASRNVLLSHQGAVLYGAVPLGERFGKLEYRAFGGRRSLAGDDGYLQSPRDAGFTFPGGVAGVVSGATLRWNAPLRGLMFGASESSGSLDGPLTYGPYPGSLSIPHYRQIFSFGRYERGPFMLAAENARTYALANVSVAGQNGPYRTDQHGLYLMTSYKLAARLTAGAYFSDFVNRQADYTSFRYQKDWAIAGRYDFNSYLYAKLEQHFIDGNALGISTTDNPRPQPDNRMTMLKLGVSF